MAHFGARLVIAIDVKKKPCEQRLPLHNRWHPEIPPVAEVKAGEVFRVEMMDFSGGRITRDYSAEDIKHADPSIVSIYNSLFLSSSSSSSSILVNKSVGQQEGRENWYFFLSSCGDLLGTFLENKSPLFVILCYQL